MKKFRVIYILLLLIQMLIFLTGCKEYGEKRIVKMLSITEDEISMLVYNYAGEKVQYDTISKKNDGIQNTIIDILKKEKFDLKLCQYCFIDEATADNKAKEVFLALNSAKFSPDINLVATNDFEDMERHLGEDLIKNPIYNFTYDKGEINGTIPLENATKSEIIIKNSKKQIVINETQLVLLNILTNKTSKHRYNFFYGGQSYSADLENATTSYGAQNNTLDVEIFTRLVSYKGMSVGQKEKREFETIMRQSMEEEAEKIFKNTDLTEEYNLFWYNNVKSIATDGKVSVKIQIS